MATFKLDEGSGCIARFAGADLSDKLYYLCKMGTDERVVLCGDGEAPLGVIYEDGAENAPVSVQVNGIAKVIAGATFSGGVKVASDGDGKAVLATTGEFAIGIALEDAGAANQIVSVQLTQPGRVA